MATEHQDLENGVVLAELGGRGDGPYCAKHAAGAALAVMGTYIVDSGDDVPYSADFVFKPGRQSYAGYLSEHVAAAREGVARVGVSVISVELKDTVDFLAASQDAGADYVSLCVHSGMEMFISRGLGEAMCEGENLGRLKEWTAAIVSAVSVPLIMKMCFHGAEMTAAALDTISDGGASIAHVNMKPAGAEPQRLDAIAAAASRCGLLIAGGGISDVESARRALDAGAGAVAIGTAAMEDETLCGKIQSALRG